MNMMRQGDLLLEKIVSLPKGLRLRNTNVVLHGETGHKHRLTATKLSIYDGDEDTTFIDLDKPTELVHEEHNTIQVDKGTWKVVRQREYSPAENRRVLD